MLARLPWFQRSYKMIPIGLSKQQALDADTKAMQQINFTGILEEVATFFHSWRSKRIYFEFFTGNSVSIENLFCFNKISI